jgi:hypothetical protein
MVPNNNNQPTQHRIFWPLLMFFFIIFLAASCYLIYKYWHKQNYYSSISSFVFTSWTGPVSPEYQVTRTLTLSSDGCTYTINTSKGAESQNCSISTPDFNKLVNFYYTDDIGTKISYNNNSQTKLPIGGQERKLTVNFSDGSSTSTMLSTDFKTNAQNFFNKVNDYVSQFKQLSF